MTNRTDDAESDALGQLVILESQREQLASLLDGNVEGPMQQLQVCFALVSTTLKRRVQQ